MTGGTQRRAYLITKAKKFKTGIIYLSLIEVEPTNSTTLHSYTYNKIYLFFPALLLHMRVQFEPATTAQGSLLLGQRVADTIQHISLGDLDKGAFG